MGTCSVKSFSLRYLWVHAVFSLSFLDVYGYGPLICLSVLGVYGYMTLFSLSFFDAYGCALLICLYLLSVYGYLALIGLSFLDVYDSASDTQPKYFWKKLNYVLFPRKESSSGLDRPKIFFYF